MNILGIPKAKLVTLGRAFQSEDEISVVIPEKNLPMKFHPKVVSVDNKKITLTMPDTCWKIVDVQPALKFIILKSHMDKMYYAEGIVSSVEKDKIPNITITHQNVAVCSERRLFYRFDIRRFFKLEKIVFPDGVTCDALKAVCLDMSPAGLGFKSKKKIPRGTRFTPGDLFDPVIPAMDGVDYYLEVLWSKGNRFFGYRNGSIFKFPTKKEQDRFTWVMDQLQINRLSWHYHNLHSSEESTTC